MTEARRDLRRDAGRRCVLAALVAVATVSGCSCADASRARPVGIAGDGGASAASPSGGAGAGGADGAAAFDAAWLAAATGFDATPDPRGRDIYFSGLNGGGVPGVFRVATSDAPRVTEIAVGTPFVAPLGIASSTSGARLYVADPGAEGAGADDSGQIFAVDVPSGAVAPVRGSAGAVARGLEVARDASGSDQIVFVGIDSAGEPGVFVLPAQGGDVSVIARGDPLADPSGLAVARDGAIYVCDSLAAPDRTATIFRIEDGFVGRLYGGFHAGYPCGIALSLDEETLVVVAENAATGAVEVVTLDAVSGAHLATSSAGLEGHIEPGGLHRGRNADALALVAGKATPPGSVFLLKR